jgi:hypothetical protein
MKECHMRNAILLIAGLIIILSDAAFAGPDLTDAELRKSVEALSAATLVDGKGWEVYERLLHPEYSRWAMGEVYEGRDKFVRSLEEWWDYGMRVAERDIDMVAVDMVGDLAIVRFRTTEAFVGPDGPVDGFSGYVSNVWIKEDGIWLLLSAEISSTARNE